MRNRLAILLGSRIKDACGHTVRGIKSLPHKWEMLYMTLILVVTGGIALAPSASAVPPADRCEWKQAVAGPIDFTVGNVTGLGRWLGGRLLILGIIILTFVVVTKWAKTGAQKVAAVLGCLVAVGIVLAFIDQIDGDC